MDKEKLIKEFEEICGYTMRPHEFRVLNDVLALLKERSNNKGDAQKMAKFRKKPVEVEAYQTDKEIDIKTLEGTMHANVGDWIITGVNGEQYPCKPDIFEKTYEPVIPKKYNNSYACPKCGFEVHRNWMNCHRCGEELHFA